MRIPIKAIEVRTTHAAQTKNQVILEFMSSLGPLTVNRSLAIQATNTTQIRNIPLNLVVLKGI
jgi:hypothetical protein